MTNAGVADRAKWGLRSAWVPCLLIAVAATVFPNPRSEWYRILHGRSGGLTSGPHVRFHVQLAIDRDHIDVIASWDKDAPGSEGDLWSRAASGEITFAQASYIPTRYRQGMLGLTQEVLVRRLEFDEPLSDEQSRAATEAVIQRLEHESEGSNYHMWAAELREFDRLYGGTQIRVLPWGYAWNAIVLIAAITAVVGCIDTVVHAPGWVRAVRRQRLVKQGRCPRCGYSTVGITGACPECGEPPYGA